MGVTAAFWPCWEMVIEAVLAVSGIKRQDLQIFIPDSATGAVRPPGSQKGAPCLSFPFHHDFSLALTPPEPCRMLLGRSPRGWEQFGGRKSSEITFARCPNPRYNQKHFGKVPDARGEAGCSARRDGEAHDTAMRRWRTTALSR